jgi:hypothetical protein
MSITPTADLIKESSKLHDYFENELSNDDYLKLCALIEVELELESRCNE